MSILLPIALAAAWAIVVVLDVSFRDARGPGVFQSIGQKLLGTFQRTLLIYETLGISTLLTLAYYMGD